ATEFNYIDPKPPGTSAASPGLHGYGAPFMDLGNYGVVFAYKEANQFVSIGNIQIPNNHTKYTNGHLESASILFNDGGTAGGVMNRTIVSMSECPGDFK